MARLLVLAAVAFSALGIWLLAQHRIGYGIACLMAAWFASALFGALRIGRFAGDVELRAQDARSSAGVSVGDEWPDLDLRGDDR
jgi:pheromone shutdown protein TraB